MLKRLSQHYADRAAVDLNIPSASATATGAAMVTTAMERMAAMTVVNFMMIMCRCWVSKVVI